MSIVYVSAQSSFDNPGSSTAVSSLTYTAGTAISSGSTICVFCTADDTAGNAFGWSVTDGASNTYTAQSLNAQDGNGTSWGAFSVTSSTGSPTQFTLTTTATFTFATIVVDVFTGVASIEDAVSNSQATPGTSANAIVSGSISPAASGDAIWCGCGNVNGTVTVGTGFTSAQNATAFVAARTEYKTGAAAGAQTATFTDATNGSGAGSVYNTVVFALKPTAVAATYVPFSPRKIYIPNRVILRH